MARTWAAAMASGPGRRNVAEGTSVARRMRLVSRARAPSVTQESVGPGPASGPPGSPPIRRKWSERKKASKPSRSASWATASCWSYEAPCWGSVKMRSARVTGSLQDNSLAEPVCADSTLTWMDDNGSDRLAAVEAALAAVERAVENATAVLGEMNAGFQRQAETTARDFEALTELNRVLDARMSGLDARMAVLGARMAEVVHELRTHSHKAA